METQNQCFAKNMCFAFRCRSVYIYLAPPTHPRARALCPPTHPRDRVCFEPPALRHFSTVRPLPLAWAELYMDVPIAPNLFVFLHLTGGGRRSTPRRRACVAPDCTLCGGCRRRNIRRGSAVSAFCDGHVVDILSVTVDGCANGCTIHFRPVGLLWAHHPGEDAKRPFCHCCARRLVC